MLKYELCLCRSREIAETYADLAISKIEGITTEIEETPEGQFQLYLCSDQWEGDMEAFMDHIIGELFFS